mgnify:CR=1 FL=1
MDRGSVLAVIPARYASTRFPGKPLVPLLGVPMIAHVVARVHEAGVAGEIVVATDDQRIAAAARQAGAAVAMTGEAPSGTDRVAQVARSRATAVVLNVQGDEPALPPENLRILAEYLVAHPQTPMATLALPGRESDLADPNTVKVVCDSAGRALYFSRAPIPYPRHPSATPPLRHMGLYGFQRSALLQFTSWPPAELERVEGLEQLRALWHGMAIQVLLACEESVAVDVPEDVPRAEAALRARTGVPARPRSAKEDREWPPSSCS